jgi:hypothetical protein
MMPAAGWRSILDAGRETEFRMAYQNLGNTMPTLAARFGVSQGTVYATARHLGLPHRMAMLQELGLPPFKKRVA